MKILNFIPYVWGIFTLLLGFVLLINTGGSFPNFMYGFIWILLFVIYVCVSLGGLIILFDIIEEKDRRENKESELA